MLTQRFERSTTAENAEVFFRGRASLSRLVLNLHLPLPSPASDIYDRYSHGKLTMYQQGTSLRFKYALDLLYLP